MSLSFGKAWWQGSPAGVELRAAWVMELSPQGHCVPFPLPPCLPCSSPWLSRGGSFTAPLTQTSPSWGPWAASSHQCGAGALWHCTQVVQLCPLSGESCWGKLLAWLAQAKQDLLQQSGIDAPIPSSHDTHTIWHHCSLQGCTCPKEQRE